MVMALPFEVGVVVRDLALMERFYCDAIGCRAERRPRVPESSGARPGSAASWWSSGCGCPPGGASS
jgi:hypothetical protein